MLVSKKRVRRTTVIKIDNGVVSSMSTIKSNKENKTSREYNTKNKQGDTSTVVTRKPLPIQKLLQNELMRAIDIFKIDLRQYKDKFKDEEEYKLYKRGLSDLKGISLEVFQKWSNVLQLEIFVGIKMSKPKRKTPGRKKKDSIL